MASLIFRDKDQVLEDAKFGQVQVQGAKNLMQDRGRPRGPCFLDGNNNCLPLEPTLLNKQKVKSYSSTSEYSF